MTMIQCNKRNRPCDYFVSTDVIASLYIEREGQTFWILCQRKDGTKDYLTVFETKEEAAQNLQILIEKINNKGA